MSTAGMAVLGGRESGYNRDASERKHYDLCLVGVTYTPPRTLIFLSSLAGGIYKDWFARLVGSASGLDDGEILHCIA